MTKLTGIPCIPMLRILAKYAEEKHLPLQRGNWESWIRLFEHYRRNGGANYPQPWK